MHRTVSIKNNHHKPSQNNKHNRRTKKHLFKPSTSSINTTSSRQLSTTSHHFIQSKNLTTTTCIQQHQKIQQKKLHTLATKKNNFNRQDFDELLLRKMFVIPSFELYGGVAGLYDYGPNGCSIMANIQQAWRRHFIQQESMMEVSCSVLTPEPVLAASGHLSRFTDWMVVTQESKEYLRADKVVENFLDTAIEKLQNIPIHKISPEQQQKLSQLTHQRNLAGGMNGDELYNIIEQYNITSNGEKLSTPSPFNLMFPTTIGPTGKYPAYLRPETAQGIFLNFKRLYEQNNRRLPMSVAQIGNAYRNEISPRGGLLRTREFTMAEIEHFVRPTDKTEPRFHKIKHLTSTFLSAHAQETIDDNANTDNNHSTGTIMSFDDAVSKGLVANESLGFFLGKTLQFLTTIGIDPSRVRFRQHLTTEMAHYACDCWDAEILTSNGWVECVGHADRSAHDLKVHSLATNNELVATETLLQPIEEQSVVLKPQKGIIAKFFQKSPHRSVIIPYLSTLDQNTMDVLIKTIQNTQKAHNIAPIDLSQLPTDGKQIAIESSTSSPLSFTISIPDIAEPIELTTDMFKIQQLTTLKTVDTYFPHVIEPSFGLGRILYALLEHSYDVRENDEQRKFLRLPPQISPYQLGLFTVVNNIDFEDVLEKLKTKALLKYNMNIQVDTSRASIGKKYSRWDETGLPYVISIDSETVGDNETNKEQTVTIRERDSTAQIKVSLDSAVDIVADLITERYTWDDVTKKYPVM